MNENDRFSLLGEWLRGRHASLPATGRDCTLIFSASDGDKRAVVRHISAGTLERAWDLGMRRIRACMRRAHISGRHLRVDWVESSTPVSWGEFQKRLSSVKRTYFRFGFALDEKFTHLLTEMECHANAIYYGGATIPTGRFNPANFSRYAQTRFGGGVTPPTSPEQRVWLVATSGVYCGPDNIPRFLPGLLPADFGMLTRGLYSGHREVRQLTPDILKEIVGSASGWLARQILPDGKFVYGYFPCFDREIASYNSLRHASSLYSLLDVVAFTRNTALLEPVARSLAFLIREFIREYEPEPGRRAAFLVENSAREIKLGANGVALLAFAKYRELTGSGEHDALMARLAEGIAFMQDRDTGSFVHVLDSETLAVKAPYRIIYYDGEAVFGLLRLYAQDGNPRWLAFARKAFDHFIDSKAHREAHDHWLSYAANEMCAVEPDGRYLAFGVNNCMSWLDFILHRETAFPTLLELMMAAQKMFARFKESDSASLPGQADMDKFKRALHYRAHYLLNGYFWPEMAMFYKNPDRIVGSFFIRHHAFRTRIDDAQHFLSGLAAYGGMLESGDPFWAAPGDARSLGSRFERPW